MGSPTSLPVAIPYRLRPRGYPLSFWGLEQPAARVPEGYSPFSGIPPAARAAAPTAATSNEMENGVATEWQREPPKHGHASMRGNARVFEVKVELALKHQFLHATQLLGHGERRHGVSGGFGEAWAVADGSMPIPDL